MKSFGIYPLPEEFKEGKENGDDSILANLSPEKRRELKRNRNIRKLEREKWFNIATLLKKGTCENRICWQEIPPGSRKMTVVLTNYRVLIYIDMDDDTEKYPIIMEIQTHKGHPVGLISENKYGSLHRILSKLLTDAFEQARNLDGAIKEIEQELSSEGPIGREPEQKQASP